MHGDGRGDAAVTDLFARVLLIFGPDAGGARLPTHEEHRGGQWLMREEAISG
jgi:hypothetical protein